MIFSKSKKLKNLIFNKNISKIISQLGKRSNYNFFYYINKNKFLTEEKKEKENFTSNNNNNNEEKTKSEIKENFIKERETIKKIKINDIDIDINNEINIELNLKKFTKEKKFKISDQNLKEKISEELDSSLEILK
jgi:hypothetical protein